LALARLGPFGADRLIDPLAKPLPGGPSDRLLTPLVLIDTLLALIPPPRRHRYPGGLAPNSPRRAALTALDREPDTATARPDPAPAPTPADTAPPTRSPARYRWTALIARIDATWPLLCRACGAQLRLIASITEREPIDRILKAIGEPTRPPRVAPARAPPPPSDALAEPRPFRDELGQPTPEFQFDQRISG
jgi:hypothetical protein